MSFLFTLLGTHWPFSVERFEFLSEIFFSWIESKPGDWLCIWPSFSGEGTRDSLPTKWLRTIGRTMSITWKRLSVVFILMQWGAKENDFLARERCSQIKFQINFLAHLRLIRWGSRRNICLVDYWLPCENLIEPGGIVTEDTQKSVMEVPGLPGGLPKELFFIKHHLFPKCSAYRLTLN